MSKSLVKHIEIEWLYSICRKVVEFERSLGHIDSVLAKTELRLAEAHRREMGKYLRSWLQEAARNFRAASPDRTQAFIERLTPDQAKLFRSICATDRRLVTRVLTRGRIRNEREFAAVRAWVEETEGQAPEQEQLAQAYKLLEQCEFVSDK